MSFLAKLTINDDTMNVLKCSHTIEQIADINGKPSQKPIGGQVSILIESTNKTDFLDWVISPNMTKDGEIVFVKRDAMSSFKTIKFKEAYCLKYNEEFDAVNSEPLTTHILISAKEISIKDTVFKNDWSDNI